MVVNAKERLCFLDFLPTSSFPFHSLLSSHTYIANGEQSSYWDKDLSRLLLPVEVLREPSRDLPEFGFVICFLTPLPTVTHAMKMLEPVIANEPG